jgi:hypothetical protein
MTPTYEDSGHPAPDDYRVEFTAEAWDIVLKNAAILGEDPSRTITAALALQERVLAATSKGGHLIAESGGRLEELIPQARRAG